MTSQDAATARIKLGLSDATNAVLRSGDTMSGALLITNSAGGAGRTFAVNTNSLVVTNENVGIGVATPSVRLDVRQAAGSTAAIFGNPLVTQTESVYLRDNTVNGAYGYSGDTVGLYLNHVGYAAGTGQYRDVQISDGKGNNVVYVDGSAKNVGIGTTAPTNTLAVVGTNGVLMVSTNFVRLLTTLGDGSVTPTYVPANIAQVASVADLQKADSSVVGTNLWLLAYTTAGDGGGGLFSRNTPFNFYVIDTIAAGGSGYTNDPSAFTIVAGGTGYSDGNATVVISGAGTNIVLVDADAGVITNLTFVSGTNLTTDSSTTLDVVQIGGSAGTCKASTWNTYTRSISGGTGTAGIVTISTLAAGAVTGAELSYRGLYTVPPGTRASGTTRSGISLVATGIEVSPTLTLSLDGGLAMNGRGANDVWVRQFNGPIYARWFGAVFDKITDDSVAISNAVVSAGGLKSVVLDGMANCLPLSFTTPATLVGVNSGGLYRRTGCLFATITTTTNLTLVDMILDGNVANHIADIWTDPYWDGGHHSALVWSKYGDLTVRNCVFTNGVKCCIYAQENLNVTGSTFVNMFARSSDALSSQLSSDAIQYIPVVTANTNMLNVVVANSVFSNTNIVSDLNLGPFGFSTAILDANGHVPTNVRITNNKFRDCRVPVLFYTGGMNVVVADNTLEHFGYQGIAANRCENATITGNVLFDQCTNAPVGHEIFGIRWYPLKNEHSSPFNGLTTSNQWHYGGVVANNALFRTTGVGISVDGDACLVKGNTITDLQLDPATSQRYGIRVGTGKGSVVEGNLIRNFGKRGVYVYDAANKGVLPADVMIRGNWFSSTNADVGVSAIDAQSAVNTIVDGNYGYFTGGAKLFVNGDNCVSFVGRNNTVVWTAKPSSSYGFAMTGLTNGVFEGNYFTNATLPIYLGGTSRQVSIHNNTARNISGVGYANAPFFNTTTCVDVYSWNNDWLPGKIDAGVMEFREPTNAPSITTGTVGFYPGNSSQGDGTLTMQMVDEVGTVNELRSTRSKKTLSDESAVAVVSLPVAANSVVGGNINYTIFSRYTNAGTNMNCFASGLLTYSASADGTTVVGSVDDVQGTDAVVPVGAGATLAWTWSADVATANLLKLSLNANSEPIDGPTEFYVIFTIVDNSTAKVTKL